MRTQSLLAIVLLLTWPALPAPAQERRFHFRIDPATPVSELLPPLPVLPTQMPPLVLDDMSVVPEVGMGHKISKDDKALEQTAHLIAKINHVNSKKRDGYLEALLARRADLSGLPFVMGDDCRTPAGRSVAFKHVAELVHTLVANSKSEDRRPSERFMKDHWLWFRNATALTKNEAAGQQEARMEQLRSVSVAALMQIFAIESAAHRVELARFLAHCPGPDAAKALARLAIFSREEDVRIAAIEGLKKHDAKTYTSVLMTGFDYPQAAVPRRAAEALVKLERKDAAAQLVDVLERPDPRSPVSKVVAGEEVRVVREVVRINHHRNCVLCHAPGNTSDVPAGTLTAAVPLPTQSLGSPSGPYNGGPPADILVRIDTTYLRQDFSMLMRVPDAGNWPEMQRFDFVVRSREVTQAQAAERLAQLAKHEPANQQAALYALRSLTGRDAGANAEAWRQALTSK